MVASSNPSPALWLYVALSPNFPCPLSSMGSMTVLHIPDVVLQSFCKWSRNSSCQKIFELSVYHAEVDGSAFQNSETVIDGSVATANNFTVKQHVIQQRYAHRKIMGWITNLLAKFVMSLDDLERRTQVLAEFCEQELELFRFQETADAQWLKTCSC